MLTVETATLISGLLTTFLANVGSVTIVGYLQAVIASWFGDDTAERLGLATLNPLAHVDVIFLISFLLIGIGFGQYPIVNPEHIIEPWRKVKFYLAHFANTILYMVLSIISLSLLLIFFGPSIVRLFAALPYAQGLPANEAMRLYPELSSLSLSLALIGIAIVHINSLLAVFSFAWNMVRLFGLPFLNYFFSDSKHKDIWIIVGVLVTIWFCLDPLWHLALSVIITMGYGLAAIFNILL